MLHCGLYICLLVDHIGVLEVFRFRYNSHTDNGQIFVMLALFFGLVLAQETGAALKLLEIL